MKKLLMMTALAALVVAPPAAQAKRINLSMNFNQDVLLAKNGPVTLRASCLQNDGGMDRLLVYSTTTSNAVQRAGGVSSFQGNGSYLTAVTPPNLSGIARVEGTTGMERVYSSIDGAYVLNIEAMQGFVVRVESSVLGINTGGDDCLLSIDITPVKKFKVPK